MDQQLQLILPDKVVPEPVIQTFYVCRANRDFTKREQYPHMYEGPRAWTDGDDIAVAKGSYIGNGRDDSWAGARFFSSLDKVRVFFRQSATGYHFPNDLWDVIPVRVAEPPEWVDGQATLIMTLESKTKLLK